MKQTYPCKTCTKLVARTSSNVRGNVFCSKSCAAIHNNKVYPKKSNPTFCVDCGKKVRHNITTRCQKCHINSQYFIENMTLEQATIKVKDNNRYTKIRQNARRKYLQSNRPKECEHCGYSNHFEICHIKDISEYSKDTLVSDINNLNNLIALCPNHHWELDNNLIKVRRTGIEPVTLDL